MSMKARDQHKMQQSPLNFAPKHTAVVLNKSIINEPMISHKMISIGLFTGLMTHCHGSWDLGLVN